MRSEGLRLFTRIKIRALMLACFSVATVNAQIVGSESVETQLTRQLSSDTEILTIETGADQFFALQNLAFSPEPAGGILILTDPRSEADWIRQSEHLRRILPEYAWTLMTLQAKSGDTPEQRLERTRTLLDELTRLEIERRVILAYGEAASTALTLATEDPELDLVLVDAIFPTTSRPELSDLMESLGETRLIDMTHLLHPVDPRVVDDARLRQQLAKQLALPGYVRRSLNAPFADWSATQLSFAKNIAGALKTHILDAEAEMEMPMEMPETTQEPPR